VSLWPELPLAQQLGMHCELQPFAIERRRKNRKGKIQVKEEEKRGKVNSKER
jgi:hypothetical protein